MSYQITIPSPFGTQASFSIDQHKIICDDLTMLISDLVGFNYCMTVNKTNGMRTGTEYEFIFLDKSDRAILFDFTRTMFSSDECTAIYNSIVHWIWQYAGNKITEEIIHQISDGKTIEIEPFILSKAGIHFEVKSFWFGDRSYTTSWDDVFFLVENGELSVFSKAESRAMTFVEMKTMINGPVFLRILELNSTNRIVRSLLTGVPH
jgi:hypothetical protein